MIKGIYKDNKGKWYIHTTIKGKSVTIRGFASRKEAVENYEYEISKWKKEHGYFNSDNEYEKVLQDYYLYRSRQITEQSVNKIKTSFRSYWSVRFSGNTIAQVFDVARCKILYDLLINDSKLNQRKKYNLVRDYLDFANYCYLQKLISEETYKEIKINFLPIKYQKNKDVDKRVATANEISAFLSAIKSNHEDLVMFTVFVRLGVRISELLGICVDCIDFETQRITIKRQLLTNGTLTDRLKTKQSYRTIPYSDEVAELLAMYKGKTGRLFNVSHTTFKRKLALYEKKSRIPNYSSHEIGRHTRAYMLAQRCENMSDVVYCAKIMGHSVSMFLEKIGL